MPIAAAYILWPYFDACEADAFWHMRIQYFIITVCYSLIIIIVKIDVFSGVAIGCAKRAVHAGWVSE